jgi:hypothetical protein
MHVRVDKSRKRKPALAIVDLGRYRDIEVGPDAGNLATADADVGIYDGVSLRPDNSYILDD